MNTQGRHLHWDLSCAPLVLFGRPPHERPWINQDGGDGDHALAAAPHVTCSFQLGRRDPEYRRRPRLATGDLRPNPKRRVLRFRGPGRGSRPPTGRTTSAPISATAGSKWSRDRPETLRLRGDSPGGRRAGDAPASSRLSRPPRSLGPTGRELSTTTLVFRSGTRTGRRASSRGSRCTLGLRRRRPLHHRRNRRSVRPELRPVQDTVDLLTEDGARALRYGELHVWDADGKELALPPRARRNAARHPDRGRGAATRSRRSADDLSGLDRREQPGERVLRLLGRDRRATSTATASPTSSSARPTTTTARRDEGRAFVYLGSARGLRLDCPPGPPRATRRAPSFGISVATAGDVNGDGSRDVIVGAPRTTTAQIDEGRAFVYHGSAAGLAPRAAWTAESDQASAMLRLLGGDGGRRERRRLLATSSSARTHTTTARPTRGARSSTTARPRAWRRLPPGPPRATRPTRGFGDLGRRPRAT